MSINILKSWGSWDCSCAGCGGDLKHVEHVPDVLARGDAGAFVFGLRRCSSEDCGLVQQVRRDWATGELIVSAPVAPSADEED